MLASCAEPPPPFARRTVAALRPGVPPPPPSAPLPRRRAFPVPERKPVPPPSDAAAPADTTPTVAMAQPGAAAPSPEAATAPQANTLVGLDEPAAAHLLGAATEKFTVPPATVWRYRTATCELDLFFYLDLRSGKMRALHYKFNGAAADRDAQQDCLRSLVIARGS